MQLDEAKKVLEENGFLVEYDIPVRSNVNIGDRLAQIKKEINKSLLIRFI